MAGKATLDRFANVRAMNDIIRSMNNEDAYMEWIYTVPDEATEEDLMDIADDEQFFGEVVRLFLKLYEEYIEDGLFIGGKLYALT